MPRSGRGWERTGGPGSLRGAGLTRIGRGRCVVWWRRRRRGALRVRCALAGFLPRMLCTLYLLDIAEADAIRDWKDPPDNRDSFIAEVHPAPPSAHPVRPPQPPRHCAAPPSIQGNPPIPSAYPTTTHHPSDPPSHCLVSVLLAPARPRVVAAGPDARGGGAAGRRGGGGGRRRRRLRPTTTSTRGSRSPRSRPRPRPRTARSASRSKTDDGTCCRPDDGAGRLVSARMPRAGP